MNKGFQKVILILLNVFYSIYFDYRVFKTFRVREEFPKAIKDESFWFLLLILLIIFNFIFEKQILKHTKRKVSIILLFVNLIIILPIIYFTINELIIKGF
ncbi:hypothetical protein SAMN05444371_3116 [Epilithonimonas mollis]|uniref:Uncharacterized protein n=1 Tax=Epilithonimonas mollis TaxID=216903 RepID=A0A1M6U4D8_9FLAO|nr:hypothetical protein SAMN05444371_3116 [Epilithonimonas mollis]